MLYGTRNTTDHQLTGLKHLAIGKIVQQRLTKTICLLTLIAVVALIGAAPVSAQSMEADTGHSCPIQEGASIPPCCLTPDHPLSHSVAASVPPSANGLSMSRLVRLVRIPASLTALSLEGKVPFYQDTPQELSAPPGARYRCRSSLTSEKPPQT